MASEDVQSTGSVDTQSDDSPDVSAPAPSRLFDDLRTRLDTPLFARDPGMTPSTGVPRLKELTWEHVVNTGSGQSDEDGEPSAEHAAEEAAGEHTVSDGSEVDEPSVEHTASDESAPDEPVAATLDVEHDVVEEPVADDAEAEAEIEVEQPADESVEQSPEVAERAPAEPSLFARLMAGDGDRASRSGEHAVIADETDREEPVLRIVEPAPAPRPSDPVVDGLAELIARATPDPGPAPAAPSVVNPPTVEPVLSQERSVQAEIDRLAFVPDSNVDDGPVEVPAIQVSGVVQAITPNSTPVVAAAPAPAPASAPIADQLSAPAPAPTPIPPVTGTVGALSLAVGEVYSAKSSAAPANPQKQPQQQFPLFAPQPLPTRRKKKRHGFRRFVTMLVLLGMVGGGLYAVKKYVIDARWDESVKPYADAVAEARGLEWEKPVGLEVLPADDYATRLAVRALGDDQKVAEEWRAMGLLNGGFAVSEIGMAALPDSPAFYDPEKGVVYVVDGLPVELRDYAINRAMTMALLDQQYDWSGRIVDQLPVVALGTRALYEADALATAQSMIEGDDQREQIVTQTFALSAMFDIPVSPSPWASVISGRLGVAMWPYFRDLDEADRDAVLRDALVTDSEVLDLRRFVSDDEEPAVTANSRGMLYWYHVLAARVDDDLAWRVALGWQGDEIALAPGTSGSCMAASLTVDAANEMITQSAFDQWMATAPLTVTAPTLTKAAGAQTVTFTVQSCDPGTAIPLDDGGARLALGGAPLRSEQFRLLLETQPSLSEAIAACAVYGADPVTLADERGVIDQTDPWTTPASHPVPDPVASGCVA